MMLGKYEINKIYNEDCYEAIKNIPDKSIDLVYIDPPYLYKRGGEGYKKQEGEYKNLFERKNNNKLLTEKLASNGVLTRIDKAKIDSRNETMHLSHSFTMDLLDELCRVLKKIYIYIWCSKEQIRDILNYFYEKKCVIDILTWHKTNPLPTMNNTYANDTEYCIMAREKGTYLYGTYETKRKYYISGINQKDKEMYLHPTIKPLDLVKNHILNSTKEGDIVLDCFIGSGTTGLACKELNRNFIGFEIEEEYYKIAVDRINGITQQERELMNKGFKSINVFDILNNEEK